MTRELISKYAELISRMERDAVENVKFAENVLQEKRKEREEIGNKLDQIHETIELNYREFRNVAKAIIKMIFKRPTNSLEIEQEIKPIIDYKEAIKSVPGIKEAFNKARRNEEEAKYELSKANRVHNMIDEMRRIQNS